MNETMGAIIARRRKELGMTQEQLAGALGISYQAVSKWENELSSPDISALPLLADTLGLTLDELFGRETAKREAETREEPEQTEAGPEQAEEEPEQIQEEPEMLIPVPAPVQGASTELPWPDDDTLYAVLFVGHRLVGHEKTGLFRKAVLHYKGEALRVQSTLDVNVEGDVRGSVSAEGDVSCGAVGGSVTAGGDVSCDRVGGPLSAVGDVTCDDVTGDVQAGGDVNCDDVRGHIAAGGDVNCDNVTGNVQAGGDVSCGDVDGDVRAEGDVSIG
jgi:transcriptional regulator with XRE-family HTH domain